MSVGSSRRSSVFPPRSLAVYKISRSGSIGHSTGTTHRIQGHGGKASAIASTSPLESKYDAITLPRAVGASASAAPSFEIPQPYALTCNRPVVPTIAGRTLGSVSSRPARVLISSSTLLPQFSRECGGRGRTRRENLFGFRSQNRPSQDAPRPPRRLSDGLQNGRHIAAGDFQVRPRANGIQRQHQHVAAHARLPQHAFSAAAARIAPRTDVRQRVVGRAEADRVVATTPSSRRWATASSPRFGHLVRWPVPGLPDWPPAIEPQCRARQQDLSVADPRVARCSTLLMRFRHHVGTS